jgi:hypothetical protein
MFVAITFGAESENKCRDDKCDYAFFFRGQDELFPELGKRRQLQFQCAVSSFTRGRTRIDR